VFGKLGIRSRVQLHGALASREPTRPAQLRVSPESEPGNALGSS
jgi:hypothetical protein